MLIALLAACRSEYAFSSVVGPEAPSAELIREDVPTVPATPNLDVSGDDPDAGWTPAPLGGGASSVRVRPKRPGAPHLPDREDRFDLGGGAPVPTDVLFVVDGSVSMGPTLGAVQAGFAAIAREGVFPPDTRVAVTGMIPRDGASRPHPAVRHAAAATFDPGFARLVDAEGIRRFNALAERLDDPPLPHRGCGAWFQPTDTDGDVPCLVAHTQIVEAAYGVEAGLVALRQLLDANEVQFRPGASVNIVFVSDTHDPGVGVDAPGYDSLVTLRPDPADLEAAASAAGPLAAFRLHAIAPATPCMAEAFPNTSYADAATASGGSVVDLCAATPADFVALMRSLAVEGTRPASPAVRLSAPADRVAAVTVDGQPVGYSFAPGGQALLLDGEVPTTRQTVRVHSTPASGSALLRK